MSFAPKRYEVPEWLLDRNLWVMLAMTALVPLSFLRRLDSLKAISYIALGTVANLVFVVIYKFLNQSGITDQDKGPVLLFDPSPKFFTSLPVQVFAFTCAQNIFGVYNELQRNTQKRLNRVIVSSIGGATIIYETLGLLGYLTFGAAVGSNIVEQYRQFCHSYPASIDLYAYYFIILAHSMLVSICQLGIVILVLFSCAFLCPLFLLVSVKAQVGFLQILCNYIPVAPRSTIFYERNRSILHSHPHGHRIVNLIRMRSRCPTLWSRQL